MLIVDMTASMIRLSGILAVANMVPALLNKTAADPGDVTNSDQ
jgi:hypothetical protein